MDAQKLFEIRFDFPGGPYYDLDEDFVPRETPQTSTGRQVFEHARSSFENNFPDLKIISYKMGRGLAGEFNGKPKVGRSLRMLVSSPAYMEVYVIEDKIDRMLRDSSLPPIYPESHAISRILITPRKNNYKL
jgi:hypothetical protein